MLQFRSVGSGQKSKMPDSDQSFGQDVHAKAPQELLSTECHVFLSSFVFVVFTDKTDLLVRDGGKACIGDGYPVGVSPDVFDRFSIAQKGCLL
jgi:hypothetical protein